MRAVWELVLCNADSFFPCGSHQREKNGCAMQTIQNSRSTSSSQGNLDFVP